MNHKSNMMGCYANPALTCFKENGDCSRCHVFIDEPITANQGGNTMKNALLIILTCLILLPAMAFAADTIDITGHWRFCNNGKDTLCSNIFFFHIKKAKNTYTIVDECSKNGPTISNIIIDGKRITFDWAYFDQKARYAGNINADHVKAYEMSGYAGDGNANWTWKTVRRIEDNPPTNEECRPFHTLTK